MKNKDIDNVMQKFDFETAHKLFLDNKWEYGTISGGRSIPTIEDIRDTAKGLLEHAKNKETTVECGRFLAFYHPDGGIGLRLVILEHTDRSCIFRKEVA